MPAVVGDVSLLTYTCMSVYVYMYYTYASLQISNLWMACGGASDSTSGVCRYVFSQFIKWIACMYV